MNVIELVIVYINSGDLLCMWLLSSSVILQL